MDYDPNDIWNKKRNRQSPPNLDEWFKKFFKGKKSGGGSDISRHLGPILGLLVVVAVLLFLGSGFYTVRQGEKAVVLRFGERYGDLIGPGLNWHIPGVDVVKTVDTMETIRYDLGTKDTPERMITKDENIIEITAFVNYRKTDPFKYLFAGDNPDKSVQQAAMSAMREVAGAHNLIELLNTGLKNVNNQIKQRLVAILKTYDLGVEVVNFEVLERRVSNQVEEAYLDVMRSREMKETLKNQGRLYKEKTIAEAHGKASAIALEADKNAITIRQEAKAKVKIYEYLLKDNVDGQDSAPYNAKDYLDQIEFRYTTDKYRDIMSKAHKIYISKEGKRFALPTLLNNSGGTLL